MIHSVDKQQTSQTFPVVRKEVLAVKYFDCLCGRCITEKLSFSVECSGLQEIVGLFPFPNLPCELVLHVIIVHISYMRLISENDCLSHLSPFCFAAVVSCSSVMDAVGVRPESERILLLTTEPSYIGKYVTGRTFPSASVCAYALCHRTAPHRTQQNDNCSVSIS